MTLQIDPRLERLIRNSARRSFGPGFGDRVMRRVAEEAAGFELLLWREFRWLAAAASLVVLVLGGYAALGAQTDQSLLDAALGLEPVSLESAYSPEATLRQVTGVEELEP